mgnify:CR=1 FL=1
MLTVNDLIGLDYSNLRNPITPRPDINYNQPFLNSNYPQPEFFPNNQQGSLNVDMGATGLIPTSLNTNAQPLIDTTGISPILQQDMDYGTSVDNFQGFTDKQDFSRPTPVKQKGGLRGLLSLALSLAVPGAGLLMRGPKGLAGLNRRFRKGLDNFFERRRYDGLTKDQAYAKMITQTRGIQKKIDSGAYDDKGSGGIGDRGRGQITSTPKATKTSSPRQSRQTSGIGGLHSGY